MTSVERLKKARELLSDKSKWIKGEFARNKHGGLVKSNDPEAECFCVLGACRLDVYNDQDLVGALWRVLPKGFANDPFLLLWNVTGYNDHRDTTHNDILALLDRAITSKEI